jgi:effector-binding domain-containing protein
MAIEEPSFNVESKNDIYEIRSYPPILVAEVFIDDDFEDSGSKGFKILADYIFGNTQNKSEKISMTAPVNQIKSASGYAIQFTMPKIYTMETLPKPNDKRITIKEIPAKKVAVIRYSGSWSKEKYDEKLSELKNALEKDNIKILGEPNWARFNSPFQLWFLRRNEIWIELEKK